MARFESIDGKFETIGQAEQADIMCELGLMYATGEKCEIDLVAAHKWLNIAAIRGSAHAEHLRSELTALLSKQQLVEALRSAREWMTMH